MFVFCFKVLQCLWHTFFRHRTLGRYNQHYLCQDWVAAMFETEAGQRALHAWVRHFWEALATSGATEHVRAPPAVLTSDNSCPGLVRRRIDAGGVGGCDTEGQDVTGMGMGREARKRHRRVRGEGTVSAGGASAGAGRAEPKRPSATFSQEYERVRPHRLHKTHPCFTA